VSRSRSSELIKVLKLPNSSSYAQKEEVNQESFEIPQYNYMPVPSKQGTVIE